jgi:hypothetical protein
MESSMSQGEVKAGSRKGPRRLGAYSRVLERGAIGDSLDGRSREGRFLRAFEASLTEHVGGSPSTTQKILIRRASRALLRLELFDEKMTSGLTDHDARVYGGLSNTLRLAMRELGLRGAADKPRTLADVLNKGRA